MQTLFACQKLRPSMFSLPEDFLRCLSRVTEDEAHADLDSVCDSMGVPRPVRTIAPYHLEPVSSDQFHHDVPIEHRFRLPNDLIAGDLTMAAEAGLQKLDLFFPSIGAFRFHSLALDIPYYCPDGPNLTMRFIPYRHRRSRSTVLFPVSKIPPLATILRVDNLRDLVEISVIVRLLLSGHTPLLSHIRRSINIQERLQWIDEKVRRVYAHSPELELIREMLHHPAPENYAAI